MMAIYSQPSLRQPESISPEFYFSSQAFIKKAQADINQLLNTWQDSVRSLPPHKKVLGPFLKFKSIYTQSRRIYIHLSAVNPALRKHWFSTLSRLLINQQNQPLKQIGALFTLWVLWSTQPESSVLRPKQYYKDSDEESFEQPAKNTSLNCQLNHHHHKNLSHHPYHHHQNSSSSTSLTIKHRAHLDPNIFGPPPPTIKPSDWIHQVLRNLQEHHAFIIQPHQAALNKDKFQKWKIKQDRLLCDPTQLNRLQTSYLSTKSFLNQVTAPSSNSAGLG
ncbi:hypothetical protein H4Q26_015941 [Puccinia striiformis f. sp. tritici PST-130]|nr:hypothetical protein H4Q26_015941 [Puccinia striiformis f. sp. tritici PST-130]